MHWTGPAKGRRDASTGTTDNPYPQEGRIPPKAGVRYYGYYSNKSCGLRKKAGLDDQLPAWVEPGM